MAADGRGREWRGDADSLMVVSVTMVDPAWCALGRGWRVGWSGLEWVGERRSRALVLPRWWRPMDTDGSMHGMR